MWKRSDKDAILHVGLGGRSRTRRRTDQPDDLRGVVHGDVQVSRGNFGSVSYVLPYYFPIYCPLFTNVPIFAVISKCFLFFILLIVSKYFAHEF